MHEPFEIIASLHRKMVELKAVLRVAHGREGDHLRKIAAEIEDTIVFMERRAADVLSPANDR